MPEANASPATFPSRRPAVWQLRTRALPLGARTLVMGIVNSTPDSFSGDGVGGRVDLAVERGLRLLEEGAAILDVGGESTRPGSGAASERALSLGEEQDRLLPVLEALRRERPEAILSADTYRAATARAAIAAGAEIINDVSGLVWDPGMAAVCAGARCGLVVMHTRGRPDDWRSLPPLAPEEVLPLVREGLQAQLEAAAAAGIRGECIVLDPGYGFGKAWDANYALLRGQAGLLTLRRPLLAGLSRKSFLGRTLRPLYQGEDPEPGLREHASLAAQVAAVLAGASLLRVHAVRPAVEAAAIADAVLLGGGTPPAPPAAALP